MPDLTIFALFHFQNARITTLRKTALLGNPMAFACSAKTPDSIAEKHVVCVFDEKICTNKVPN